ncbi:hypothetical protein [Halomonas sp. 25-S5]|uniref:hypothetical protein n=1 Tax=Halomonas sp. 25-S5 TaxID=2994065 RepID=UPI002468816D|nr:hypothetical protein [Halomonas sp. 25-S5]
MKDRQPTHHEVSLSPTDLLAGLGGANRELIATCLALFDDSRWKRRLETLHEQAIERMEGLAKRLGHQVEQWLEGSDRHDLPRLPAPEVEEAGRELGERQHYWLDSNYSDDLLRLLLWARLRVALGLSPRLTTSFRGCGFLADDMAARLIHVLDPPGLVNSGRRWLHQRGWFAKGQHATTLDDVVMPILDELLEQALMEEASPPTQDQRHEILRQAIASLNELSGENHDRLLDDTQANRRNDAAFRNALLLVGSLSGFGISVSAAGFSAYILAAQASAFIPLVSGPGLVSFVSVMSNPITVLGVAGGGSWWFFRSANEKVRVAVAARVMAMLTLQGKLCGGSGMESARRCFSQAAGLPVGEGVSAKELKRYRDEWQWLSRLPTRSADVPPDDVLDAMAQPIRQHAEEASPLGSRLSGETQQSGEKQAAAAMATLTAGDVLYSVAAVDPTVIAAADFSRAADIGVGLSIAEMAEQILDGSDRAILGGVSQLKGYVAEKAVAAQLSAAGHTVSFPDAANEPGWDLLVDGQEFQVKFHTTLGGLREHFQRYDYPVIANTELVDQIPPEWADKVFFVDGLSNELVEQVTRDSLSTGVEILNPSVISFAGSISAVRGLVAYRRGQLTGKQAIEQIMLDGMVRMGLAGSGSVVGAGVGMMMFGPAGAWVFGAGAPVMSQMLTTRVSELLRQKVKSQAHREWESQAHQELSALQAKLLESLTRKQRQLDEKLEAVPNNLAGDYLRWRLQDDRDFAQECQGRLQALDLADRPLPEQRLTDTLREMAMCGVHPAIYQPELHAVVARIKHRPELANLLDGQHREYAAGKARDMAGNLWGQASERVKESGAKEKMSGLIKGLTDRMR